MRKEIEIIDNKQVFSVEYSENNGELQIHAVWINIFGSLYDKGNEDVIILYCDDIDINADINLTPYSSIKLEKVKQAVNNKIK
jgi:hypothetical protein